jgi:hypothetical protein
MTHQQNRNSRDTFHEGCGGIPPNGRKRNEDIRKETHVTDVITRIKNYQKWWEHVERI